MSNHVSLQHRFEDGDDDMDVREEAVSFDSNDDAASFSLEFDNSGNINDAELNDADQPAIAANYGDYDDLDRVEFMLDDNCTFGISKEESELHPGIHILLQDNVGVDFDEYEEEEEVGDLFDDGIEERDEPEAELEELPPIPLENDDSNRPLSYFAKVIDGFKNQLYFMNEHNHDENGGIRNIVARAGAGAVTTNEVASVNATKSLLSLTDLLVHQPRSVQDKILQDRRLLLNMCPSGIESDVEIPVDRDGANRLCLRDKFSVFANVPSSRVFEIDNHACISLSDVLDMKFAQGIEFAFIKADGKRNRDGFNGTPRAEELLKELERGLETGDISGTYFGHLMFWSDSFLKCFSRQKDNSIWLFVVRISAPESLSTSNDHTVCLAMGSSNECHDGVIAHYMNEVRAVMKGKARYYGREGVKTIVNTSFGLGIYLADTPERNSILSRLHLGTHGKRSGVAGKVDPVGLPSCQRCFERMVKKLLGIHVTDEQQCHRCCDWDQFSPSNANRFDKTEGTKYPTSCSTRNPHNFPPQRTVNETHTVCIKQSFTQMISSVKAAFFEYGNSDGTWKSQDTVKYYLALNGISTKVQTWVCQAGRKARRGETVNESYYIPTLWQLGFSFDLWIETAMHLLGHGIIATILELIESVLSDHYLWKDFRKFANPFLEDIATFKLAWCHVKSLPKANWLAEDCFGYGRLMLFLYGQYFGQKSLPDSAGILSACLPQLKQLLCSCNVMICKLMSRAPLPEEQEDLETHIELLNSHIKVFLSCCHRFAKSYYTPDVAEFWFNKSNCKSFELLIMGFLFVDRYPHMTKLVISLLNLPQQIAKFGPLGLTW